MSVNLGSALWTSGSGLCLLEVVAILAIGSSMMLGCLLGSVRTVNVRFLTPVRVLNLVSTTDLPARGLATTG